MRSNGGPLDLDQIMDSTLDASPFLVALLPQFVPYLPQPNSESPSGSAAEYLSNTGKYSKRAFWDRSRSPGGRSRLPRSIAAGT